MFEEILQPKETASLQKRSQLIHLLQHEAHSKVLHQIEKEAAQTFSARQRKDILLRIREEYGKRPLPETTYEDWLVTETPKKENASDRIAFKTDFHVYVKKVILGEIALTEGRVQNDTPGANGSVNDAPEGSDAADREAESDSSFEVIEEDEEHEDNKDILHPDAVNARMKIKQWSTGYDTKRTWARDRYQTLRQGYETAGELGDLSDYTAKKLHGKSLKILLHLSILRQNWDTAYRIFSLLIHFKVDLRSMWPLGAEILARRNEELKKTGKHLKFEHSKEKQFLDWMALSFNVTTHAFFLLVPFRGPVFRSGSRTHAPMYVLVSMWQLLVEQRYSKLRDLLEELLLQPPYSSDGAFHFLMAMCCLAENIHLVSLFLDFDKNVFNYDNDIGDLADDMMLIGSKETLRARILSNINKAHASLKSCEEHGFAYPGELIEAQITDMKALLDGDAGELARRTLVLRSAMINVSKQTSKPTVMSMAWVQEWFNTMDFLAVCKACAQEFPHGDPFPLALHLQLHDIHRRNTVLPEDSDCESSRRLDSGDDTDLERRASDAIATDANEDGTILADVHKADKVSGLSQETAVPELKRALQTNPESKSPAEDLPSESDHTFLLSDPLGESVSHNGYVPIGAEDFDDEDENVSLPSSPEVNVSPDHNGYVPIEAADFEDEENVSLPESPEVDATPYQNGYVPIDEADFEDGDEKESEEEQPSSHRLDVYGKGDPHVDASESYGRQLGSDSDSHYEDAQSFRVRSLADSDEEQDEDSGTSMGRKKRRKEKLDNEFDFDFDFE